MNNKIGLLFVFSFVIGAVACSPGSGYRINGVINGSNGFPVDQATIFGCKTTVAMPPDNTFSMGCNAGDKPQVIMVKAPGYAPSINVIQPIAGLDYSLFVTTGMKLDVTDVDVKADSSMVSASTKGFSMDGQASAFQTISGGDVRGNLSISMAYWDCVLSDKMIKPFFGGMLDENYQPLKVWPIAIGYVDVTGDGKEVKVRDNEKFSANLTAGDLGTTNINSWSTENKLYYFDQAGGVFVEKPFQPVNHADSVMRFSPDATGFWIWAKPMVKPTCMQVKVNFPNGKGAAGAQVDMEGERFTRQGFTSDDGSVCIESEKGYVVNFMVRTQNQHTLTAKKENISFTMKDGSCETACQGKLEISLKCLDDTDCEHSYTCKDGTCTK